MKGGTSHSAPHAQWPENHISGGSHGPSGCWTKPHRVCRYRSNRPLSGIQKLVRLSWE
ncbi:hypothetical protein BDQ94DRAFT_132934 [Aspergillus welwitschiae]|uniref:Uncharacterized protein n=1 Tax=Aspergillus welwitschiae TaxID=1341132 RepID=A0A3F3QJB2_9EURO|nr:hypothetical protein BDQ94DRAFT_132934 [Aspergillus welwitschiae]RDH39358.1 hypothetical protein BDQ94DRAFT_132934 [Aspergillus welwitschiae]